MFQPLENKNDVLIEVRKDGTARWTIIDIPTTPLVKHNTMPDPRPPKRKTIIDNGTVTHFDAEDNIIRVLDVDMQPFNDMLSAVYNGDKENDYNSSAFTINPNSDNISVATERDDRFVTYTEIDPETGYKSEYTKDTEDNLIIQTKVYDEQNQEKNRTRMQYDRCTAFGENPVLERLMMKSSVVSPQSALELINTITIQIQNLSIEDYQP